MITEKNIVCFQNYLEENEKSKSTIQKYIHDVTEFVRWISGRKLNKCTVIAYKTLLAERYATASVNSVLCSLNSFFLFDGRYDLRVKSLKIQRQIFSPAERELTKAEYESLLSEAKKRNNVRLYLLMQTICSTGIRVSELRYITAEAVQRGYAEITCKGKRRQVFLPAGLCKLLKGYIRKQKISSGAVFITKNSNPLDRSNIWSDMKKLCESAGVSEKKVFPHNLRHLFARTFYTRQKDIVRLADILGHSNVSTTRIYTRESGEIHRRQIQELGLLQC